MEGCCTRSFSLLSWLVLYILAFASYKVGSTAMALGQVQGSVGGWPSPPQDTDTFKGSRATRTEHNYGKEVPLHEQDGPSHLGLSRTPLPHPGASRSTSVLSLVKRVGHQERGLEQGAFAGRHTLRSGRHPPWEPV